MSFPRYTIEHLEEARVDLLARLKHIYKARLDSLEELENEITAEFDLVTELLGTLNKVEDIQAGVDEGRGTDRRQ